MLIIRSEASNDYPIIYDLIKTAFQTASVADGDEQDIAVRLRQGSHYIAELALVASINNKLVGHIMFTKTYVNLQEGSQCEALLLAPLAVLLEYRRQGVGAALVKRGFELAKVMGFKAVFVCGDPAYYKRFGFVPVANFAIDASQIPAPYAMAYELVKDGLKGITGTVGFEV